VRLLLAIVILLVAGVPAASARTIELGTAINDGGFAGGGQAYATRSCATTHSRPRAR
jgi:hypothetical protein